jgi:hypothetical protein
MNQHDRQLAETALAECREEVILALQEHYAHGRLSLEEFEERLETAHGALTRERLSALTADLPAVPAAGASGSGPLVNRDRIRDDQTFFTIFSNHTQRGAWRPARNVKVISIFGKHSIDFREARLPPGESTIMAVGLFGKSRIILPRGVTVNAFGFGLAGKFRDRTSGVVHAPDAPTINIKGFALFGQVDICEE